jgi:hypothetical protein
VFKKIFHLFQILSDNSKRSKLSKLELWLNGQSSYIHQTEQSGFNCHDQLKSSHKFKNETKDDSGVIYSLLEDSLMPLKCNLNLKCLSV